MGSRAVILPALFSALLLAGCASAQAPAPQVASLPPGGGGGVSPPPAPGLAADDLVGRWGLASYQRESDRARTITQARAQCGQAYVIGRGSHGGVMMHLPDQRQTAELRTKGGPDGKRYIGPEGPIGDPGDREVMLFDGKVMLLRWLDPEVAGRYGTMVYVRCSARA